jgi:hypothetical protein
MNTSFPLRLMLLAVSALLALSVSSISAACDKQNPAACSKPTAWNEFESVRLKVQQGNATTPIEWFLQTSRETNDIRVEIDFPDSKKPMRGVAMMVGGYTLLLKGSGFVAGQEIDALDGPVLSIGLLANVLGRALPNGPLLQPGSVKVNYKDQKVGIKFATPSAGGYVPPPWSVNGALVANADGSHDFDLTLTWSQKEQSNEGLQMTMRMTGQLKHLKNFKIDDSMSLDGWQVFGIGPIVEKTSSGTRYDYGATPSKTTSKTVADIRKAIADELSPGEPDLSTNYAGFWKQSCSDTFGLRIKPADAPGMYTVTFCGPGGCGDEGRERKTYLTGDKHYKVVSPTELHVGRGDNKSTYKKCSEKMLP